MTGERMREEGGDAKKQRKRGVRRVKGRVGGLQGGGLLWESCLVWDQLQAT